MKPKLNKTKKKIITAVIITSISLIFSYFISLTEPIIILQNSIYDSFFRIKSNYFKFDKTKTDDIIIIAIDEASINNLLEKKNIKWPWPRELYGYISDHLINEGAKAVIIDVIFSTPDIDQFGIPGYGEESDKSLYNVILKSKKIIIPFNIDKNIKSDKKLNTLKIDNINKFKNVKTYKSLIPPYYIFTIKNNNFGFVEINEDTGGTIREYIPFVKIKDNNYPSIAAAIYLLLNDKNLPESLDLNKNGTFKINWYGPGGINNTFKYSPILMVLSDYLNKKRGVSTEIPKGTFKDKIVFIGATARGLLDMKNTPFSYKESYPGVEIHATAYLNLVNKDWIKKVSFYFEFPFYFILITLLIFLGIEVKSIFKYSIFYFLIIILLFISHFFIFTYFNIMSNTVLFAIFFIILSYLLIQISNYITIGKNRNIIKKAFSAYLSPDLLKRAINIDNKSLTKGDIITASVLFIDIVGFTTYSEKNPVEKVVETLNLYLNKFSEVIINNKGFVNKFLGDGLMALFGAPTPFDEHADNAVKSAFECYHIYKELYKSYGLHLRIGVNSGKMIVGDLGGHGSKIEYTAIGDCINTSSRLEGANKFFNTNILVGEDTKKLLKNVHNLKYLGQFNLKGKDIPYGIYYFNEANKQHKERFNLMVNAYENNDIDSFKRFITYFLSNNVEFGPAIFYIKYFKNNENSFGEPIKLSEK